MPSLDEEAKLGREIVVDVDPVGRCDNLAAVVLSAGWTDMMRTLFIAATRAFLGVCNRHSVVAAAHIAARRGYFVLRDSHVSTSILGHQPP